MNPYQVGDIIEVFGTSRGNYTTDKAIVKKIIDGKHINYEGCEGHSGFGYTNYAAINDVRLINHESKNDSIINKSMNKISLMMKKLLNPDLQTLVKANFINGNLDLTDEGQKALNTILFSSNQKELVEMAEAKLDEEKEEKCC